FRLGVQTGGCSDWLYTMGFDQTVQPEDQVYTCGGIQVVIDNRDLDRIDGLTIDYSEDLMGGGFRFHNPKAFHHCGCGNSFSIKEASH
ncbi:MAG: iron-sulfur cluster assembly accessory protein, partial [Cyanothece sp. SIO1E1]|nr:iron-sulfur cluster assembly accessory protein [Cyanothece sp. SIO1E1]